MKKFTKRRNKILGARSVKEILALLKPIDETIENLDEATVRLLKSVSGAGKTPHIHHIALSATEHELGTLTKKQSSSPKSPAVRSVLDSYKAPDVTELTRDNTNLAELTASIQDLDIAEQVLLGSAMSNLPSRDSALKHVRKLRDDAGKVLDKHLKAMSKIANSHTPTQHRAVVSAAIEFIKTQLNDTDYSAITKRSFIYQPKKSNTEILHYQTYILIEDFVNHEGDIYDRYSVVITGELDIETGTLIHHATSIKDHMTPGSFNIGPEVETFAKLKRRIITLFNVDSFLVRGLRKTLPQSSEYLRKNINLSDPSLRIAKNSFNNGSEINSIRIKNNEVYIQLQGHLTDEQELEAVSGILASLRKVFVKEIGGSRNAITRTKLKGRKSGKTWYVFAIVPAKMSDQELTSKKLNDITKSLNLTPAQVASIRQTIIN